MSLYYLHLANHAYRQKRQKTHYTYPENMAPSAYTKTVSYLSAPKAPSRMRSLRLQHPRDDVDDFLSSDLELSFASTMSLNSPNKQSKVTTPGNNSVQPMDISPPHVVVIHPQSAFVNRENAGRSTRPRAFTSATRRTFGDDLSNNSLKSDATQSGGRRTQRAALPTEWLTNFKVAAVEPPTEKGNESFGDAMDVDSDALSPPPSGQRLRLSSPPVLAAVIPTKSSLANLFFNTVSPRLSPVRSPSEPLPKKRRSYSPDAVESNRRALELESSSSPGHVDSPSQRKLDRISSGPLSSYFNQLAPHTNNVQQSGCTRPMVRRRPIMSAIVQPSEPKSTPLSSETVGSDQSNGETLEPSTGLPPPRRAFSAMIIPNGHISSSPAQESSPAQAYAKRQQVKTIRRCDGTEDFRPLTGATALAKRDFQQSPSTKMLSPGMPGFGDNEACGKILPCHRVKDDGLMRIKPETLDQLLDGKYSSKITEFLVIDCRFDYEYNGGHIPGAINVNTTAGVEDLLLAPKKSKPKQCVSTDLAKKTVLIFHCEFSVKRAPTFAKYLRSKDRALSNHVYPRIHYPEVYILEGGYCQYYKTSGKRCQPPAYVAMDDPNHMSSRREDLDQFRKAKFGRTKSYAYGDGLLRTMTSMSQQHCEKRSTAPTGIAPSMFAAGNAARTRRGGLTTLAENDDVHAVPASEGEDTDIGESPCPMAPVKAPMLNNKRTSRGPIQRAETYNGPMTMASMAY